jgi:hypothetical protein
MAENESSKAGISQTEKWLRWSARVTDQPFARRPLWTSLGGLCMLRRGRANREKGRAHTHLGWGSNLVPLLRFACCLLLGQAIVLPPDDGLQRHLL